MRLSVWSAHATASYRPKHCPIALATSFVAALALLYMSALGASDWLAAKILAEAPARTLASRLCARVSECEHASIGSSFDWRYAHRIVLVRLEARPHSELSRESAREALRVLAAQVSEFTLRWALRGDPVIVLGPAGSERGDGKLPDKGRR